MLIFKAGLRLFLRRRIETIAIILLIMVITSFYISLYLDKDNFTRYIYMSKIEGLGHVSIYGRFNDRALELLEVLDGIDHVIPYYYWRGYMYGDVIAGNRSYRFKYTVGLMDVSIVNTSDVHIVLKEGRYPLNESEVLLYISIYDAGGENEFKVGDSITVYCYGMNGVFHKYNLTIVGYAIGLAIFDYTDYTLLVNHDIIQDLVNDTYTWIAVYSKDQSDSGIEELSENVLSTLKSHGYNVTGYRINKPRENEVNPVLDSVMAYFTIPIVLALVLIAVVALASGVSLVERNTRLNGVLRAIGCSRSDLFIIYFVQWFLRGLIGILLAIAISPYLARTLLFMFGSSFSTLLDYLINAYGFNTEPYTLIKPSIVSLTIVLTGSIIPGLMASRINIVDAVQFTGLKPRGTIGFSGGARSRIALRNLFSRPWKFLSLLAIITIILSLMTGITANVVSMYREYYRFIEDMPADTILYVYSVSYTPVTPLNSVYGIICNSSGVEEATYTVSHMIVNGLGHNEILKIYAIVNGTGTSVWRVIEGRYPTSSGEIAISKTIAILLKKGVGDSIEVTDNYGVVHRFRIVGVIDTYNSNGFTVFISLDDFALITRLNVREILLRYPAEIYIRVKGDTDPDDLGFMLKGEIESNPDYCVHVYTRNQGFRQFGENVNLLVGILYSILFIVYIVGVIGLTSIFIIDFTGRLREIGVFRAIGFTNLDILLISFTEIIVATLLSLPISYAMGYILAESLNMATILAKGYIDLGYSWKYLFSPTNVIVLLIAYILSLAIIYLYLRRQKTAELLRID